MTDETKAPVAAPLSKNEGIKERSRFLRGGIAEGLTRLETGSIDEEDQQLTKFHGIYLQDDRDLRPERGRKKMEKAFIFMARLRIPGGEMTPAQWLAMEDIGRRRANGTIRLTTRQTIQFHGIIKTNLKPALQEIHAAMLDTVAACGDVNRNVICSSNPYRGEVHAEVLGLSRRISEHLLPKSRAWHEIWLDEERVAGGEEEDEPILGRTYLPRKFKIALAVPPTNDTDVFAHDLGYIAIVEDGRIVGYNVVAGGGMGMTHGEPDTFPRTGDVIGFCTPDQAVDVAEKIVTTQRDYGDRSSRKHARLKYTIEDRGVDWFRAEVERRLGYRLQPARPYAFAGNGDRYGWIEGEGGRWHHTVFVENGRIHDRPERRLLTGLRAIARAMQDIPGSAVVLTCNQNLTLSAIPANRRAEIDALLEAHGLGGGQSALRRSAMACVALPTCGLALAESERYLPDLVTALEGTVEEAGLRESEITLRMTGCPNGCARPYLAEIALVGRGPGRYNLYLGAAHDGSRLNKLYRRDADHDAIVQAVSPLLRDYARGREDGEHFGDWVIRAGHVKATTAGHRFHADLAPELAEATSAA